MQQMAEAKMSEFWTSQASEEAYKHAVLSLNILNTRSKAIGPKPPETEVARI